MKRANVIVDEDLLERARQVSGERTYSGTINFVLQEYLRRHNFKDAMRRAKELAGPDFFAPGYVEEMWPDLAEPRRAVADVRRAAEPVKKSRRRVPR